MRILFVDDDASVRSVLSEVLEREGHTVVTARDGCEAVGEFARSGPFDVLVTEIAMEGYGGAELIMRLRAIRCGIPTICITGAAHTDSESYRAFERAMQIWATLQKPFDPDDLVKAVDYATQ